MKILEASKNPAGGYDLLTERDGGNHIRVLTGNCERSLEYWERLLKLTQMVTDDLKNKPPFHQRSHFIV